jgi:hypothetical protein
MSEKGHNQPIEARSREVRSSAYSGPNKLRVSGLSSHVGQSLCGVQHALLGCPSAARARGSSGAGECGAVAAAWSGVSFAGAVPSR